MLDNKSKHPSLDIDIRATHSHNTVILLCDIFFSVFVIREVFLLAVSVSNVKSPLQCGYFPRI